ncbi:hypothetical protein BDQ17DRAFT_1426752 [Cyathus striatus]|nr:hypothetical protein BDQ17DRAFT_1426752 [Cyathus striatus]
MRFSVAALTILGAALSASASTLLARQSIPTCGQPCILNADLGSCSATDTLCLCQSSAFVSSTTQCIVSSCSGQDLQDAEAAARALCAQVGVTLTDSVAASSTTAASGSSTGAAASSTATSPAASGSGSSTRSGSSAASTPASSSSSSAPATSSSASSASKNGINAVAGLAAIGLAALAL